MCDYIYVLFDLYHGTHNLCKHLSVHCWVPHHPTRSVLVLSPFHGEINGQRSLETAPVRVLCAVGSGWDTGEDLPALSAVRGGALRGGHPCPPAGGSLASKGPGSELKQLLLFPVLPQCQAYSSCLCGARPWPREVGAPYTHVRPMQGVAAAWGTISGSLCS